MSQGLKSPGGFNTNTHLVALPRDFVSACVGLSGEAVLLLVHYFSICSSAKDSVAYVEQEKLLENFSKWHGSQKQKAKTALDALLEKALLIPWRENETDYLIAGTPEGRFLYQNLSLGEKSLLEETSSNLSLEDERPNIFKLYETHIGIITPMMAEQLKQDEIDFPAEWIEDAVREAVERNARNWKYVKAILLAWKERGRDKRDEGHQSDIEAFRRLTRQQQERDQP